MLLIVDTLNQVSYIKTMQENMSQTTANMTRNQIIEEAIDTACTTWEVSADWNSTVRAAKESMSERGLKPSRQLVLYVAKLARLPIQLN